MHIQVSRRWIDVEFNNGHTIEFQRNCNIAYVYQGDGHCSSVVGFEPIDSFPVLREGIFDGIRPTMLDFTLTLGAYAQFKGYETTVNTPAPRDLIDVDHYIAIAIACGCSDPAVARAEWEELQAKRMLSLIG